VALGLLLPACGGGGGASSSSSASAVSLPPITGSNVAPIAVRLGPTNNVNIPYVSVAVCLSGAALDSSGCHTIDNVLVDTGSYGLRLFASQVSPFLSLPPQTVGSSSVISECANFLNNSSAWGSVSLADVAVGGERAHNVPVQLMDASAVTATINCGGTLMTTPDATSTLTTRPLSANGILGVGVFTNDAQNYFDCAASSVHSGRCLAIYPAPTQQVQNPVALFTTNNNGVVVALPSLGASGMASSATGYLIFGVNTQSNNQLGAAKVVPLDVSGFFTTDFHGQSMAHSIFDSGSNGLYFDDPIATELALCSAPISDFYCPASPVPLGATIHLASGSATANFSIASANSRGSNYALGGLGGPLVSASQNSNLPVFFGFDWGLPFFYGRSVYSVIEGKTPPGSSQTGPFNAFTN
jgi:hypothetical protein